MLALEETALVLNFRRLTTPALKRLAAFLLGTGPLCLALVPGGTLTSSLVGPGHVICFFECQFSHLLNGDKKALKQSWGATDEEYCLM